VIRDRGQWAELAVLATVLAIAALASYIHLREVWLHAGAPVAAIGPLTVDGLFAAAWLRMRRRRGQGERVGFLAWLALGLALVATVAGNLAAAVIAGHRDPLSLVVAAWPAVAFAVVWELVTGHSRQAASVDVGDVAADLEHRAAIGVAIDHAAVEAVAEAWRIDDDPQVTTVAELLPADSPEGGEGVAPYGFEGTTETKEGWEAYTAHLIGLGFGRKRLARELDLSEHEARALLVSHRARLEGQEATG
jgi:hypothetical protein